MLGWLKISSSLVAPHESLKPKLKHSPDNCGCIYLSRGSIVHGETFSRQHGVTLNYSLFYLSLNYLNILIFYLVTIWYLFHLNTYPPFGKTTRTNWKQECLHGKPTSCCFPEAMREYGVEMTLTLFADLSLHPSIIVSSLMRCTSFHLHSQQLPFHSAGSFSRVEAHSLKIQSLSTDRDSTIRLPLHSSTQLHQRLWSQEIFTRGWVVVTLDYFDNDQIILKTIILLLK